MRFLKKSGLLVAILSVTVLLSILPAQKALGWGAVSGVSTVHQLILNTAYDFLRSDHALAYTIFPSIEDILANEGVTNPILKTGPGPDGAESNSPWSEHWYNPDSPGDKGRPPESVAREYRVLAQAIVNGETGASPSGDTPAHAAAWGAHFLADIETSFHTNGTSLAQIEEIYRQQGGFDADAIILGPDIVGSLDFCYSCALTPDWDFKAEIESFFIANAQDPNADWFDPWYFNGATGITSSHVLYEGGMGNVTDIPAVTSYSSEWHNPAPSFTGTVENHAIQAAAFTKLAAENSRRTQLEGLNNPTECVARAAQRVATLWRASIAACNPAITVSVPDKKHPEKLKVTTTIRNHGNGNCTKVQAKLSVTGGVVLDSGPTKDVADFGGISSSKPVSWNIEVTNLSGATLNVEVIYSYSQPDLQYVNTKYYTGKIEPAETTKTTEATTEPKTTSVIILFNASSQMGKISHTEAVPMVLKALEALPDSVIEVAVYAYGESYDQGDCSVWGNPFMTRSQVVEFANSLLTVKTETRGSAALAKGITTSGNVLTTQGKGNTKVIVLISNSAKDTCGGDPKQAAKHLAGVKVKKTSSWFVEPAYAADGDTSVSLQVIGVYVDTSEEEQGLKDLAAAGSGQYFPVDNVDQMTGALEKAIKAGESSSGSFFDKLQVWWFVAGGIFLLLIIVLLARGRQRVKPAVQTAGVPVNLSVGAVAPPAAPVSPPERKTLFCPKCGSQTYQGAVFCVRCGSSLELATPLAAIPGAAPQAGIFCPRCGTANTAGSAFCNKCGAGIQPGVQPAQTAPAQPVGKKNYWAYWLLSLLPLIGGLIAWATLRKENPSMAGRLLIFSLFIAMLIFYGIVQNMI